MTKKEFNSVLSIMLTADNGCPVCVRKLLLMLREAFPQYKKPIEDAYEREFNSILDKEYD